MCADVIFVTSLFTPPINPLRRFIKIDFVGFAFCFFCTLDSITWAELIGFVLFCVGSYYYCCCCSVVWFSHFFVLCLAHVRASNLSANGRITEEIDKYHLLWEFGVLFLLCLYFHFLFLIWFGSVWFGIAFVDSMYSKQDRHRHWLEITNRCGFVTVAKTVDGHHL